MSTTASNPNTDNDPDILRTDTEKDSDVLLHYTLSHTDTLRDSSVTVFAPPPRSFITMHEGLNVFSVGAEQYCFLNFSN